MQAEAIELDQNGYYHVEELPNIDFYRAYDSITGVAQKRPNLQQIRLKISTEEDDAFDQTQETISETSKTNSVIKLGWIKGVMVRCLLALLGSMMYIRLPYIMGFAGVYVGSLIILASSLLSILTTLSLAAVATNGKIKAGGTYFLLSRTLGPEFGGPIGITMAVTDLFASSMIVIGVGIVIQTILKANRIAQTSFIAEMNGLRVIAVVVIAVLGTIIMIGLNYESMLMLLMLVILIASFCNMFISLFLEPSVAARQNGYTGPNITTLKNNLMPTLEKNTVFGLFGTFFPAMSGILAGVNISGNLKKPQHAIPRGTISAAVIATVIYLALGIMSCATMVRKTFFVSTSNITEMAGLIVDTSALNFVFGHPIPTYCGALAATLSSVSAVLVSGPKVFQAVCRDEILPGVFTFFAHGNKKSDEPQRLYMLNFLLSAALAMIGNLNAIAHLVTNFTLVGYAFINFACFYASYSKAAGWRPKFRYFNPWVALSTAILCVAAMFIVDVLTAIITIVIEIILFLYVRSRKNVIGDHHLMQNKYRSGLHMLRAYSLLPHHAKTFRPQCLILSGAPNERAQLVQFFNEITKKYSLSICGNVIQNMRVRQCISDAEAHQKWLCDQKFYSFYSWVLDDDIYRGIRSLMQCSGFGSVRPNILVMGFKNNWKYDNLHNVLAYVGTIHDAFDMSMGVALTRLAKGSGEIPPADLFPFVPNKANDEDEDDIENVMDEKYQSSREQDENKCRKISITSANKSFTLDFTDETRAYIDVWWLFEDGGLTILLPYLLSTRRMWKKKKLRVFIPCMAQCDGEYDKMAHMLDSFRISYDQIVVVSDFFSEPSQEALERFNNFISDVRQEKVSSLNSSSIKIYDADVQANQSKINRCVKLTELLIKYSDESHVIFITLPVPQHESESIGLYLGMLDFITKDLPPTILLRGNHENVLTYYA